MKHISIRGCLTAICSFLLFTLAPAARAQYTAGNVVVLQAGNGTSPVSLTNTGNPILLREFSSTGVSSTTVTVPSTGNNPLIISGSATSEGLLTRSATGTSLVFAGYAQALPNATSLAAATAATINRAIGTVDATGTFSRVATSSTFHSANNIRGAASDGANNYWSAGANDGTDYFGTGTASIVQNTITNSRSVAVFNGKLYLSAQASGSFGVYQVGTGLPVTSGQTVTSVISTTGTGTGSSAPAGFFFNPAGTICYIADGRTIANGGGIQKWTLSASTWSLAYTLGTGTGSTVGAFGVAADFSGASPIVYATTTEGTLNRLIKITDTGSGSTASTLATATANTIFRGVAFAPVASCPSITATLTGTTTVCTGSVASLTATITGGTSPYSLTYSDGTTNTTVSNYASGAAIAVSPAASKTYTIVALTDANTCSGTASGSAIVTVNPPPTTASAGASQTITTGTSATLAANTPTTGTGSWSVTSGPSTASAQFSSTTNPAATFTPAGGPGDYVLAWTISNAPCTSSVSSLTLTNASPQPQPPVAPTLPDQTGKVAVPFSYTVPAFTDPESQTLSYAITGVPAGLTADNNTRVISGTPTTTGVSTVTVVATDPTSASTAGTFTISIDANAVPVPSTVASLTATAGVPFSLTVPAFSDPESQTLTYTASGVPSPLGFDPSTRVISGTPSTTGVSAITVTATDPASNTASLTFSLTVNAAPATPAGVIRITEYMYSSANGAGNGVGEFVELTNVGNAAIDLTGWSFDDNSRTAGSFSIGGFGVVQPNESVIVTDAPAPVFRTFWYLPASVKVIGGNDQNLGRSDEINIYDASNTLVTRLTYNDQGTNPAGTVRTQFVSAWPQRNLLGQSTTAGWQLSVAGDAQNSYVATTSDLGNPGGYFVPLNRVLVRESGGTTAVTEGGTTDTYTVALNSQPTADVTIGINAGSQLTTAPTSLTFTPSNFSTVQTVTVTAVDDAVYQGAPRSVTLTQSAASSDAAYNAIAVNPVSVTITDNDVAATLPPTIRVAGTTTAFLNSACCRTGLREWRDQRPNRSGQYTGS